MPKRAPDEQLTPETQSDPARLSTDTFTMEDFENALAADDEVLPKR